MNFWKSNVVFLVPDPATAQKSDYREQAEWLVVVNELNPESCRDLIARWRVDHDRRRNLWKAIRETGLYI